MLIPWQVCSWKSRVISQVLHEKIDYKNYTFEVMNIEERRISKIKVTVHPVRNERGEFLQVVDFLYICNFLII